MKHTIIITVLLLAGIHLPVRAQDVMIAPNRNVELLGIVYNTASGYTPGDDGYTLAPDAAYMKVYSMYGDRIARHRAVRLIKKIAKKELLWENEVFELGLCFEEGDFSRPEGGFRPTAELEIPIVKRFIRAMDDFSKEDYIRNYFSTIYPADYRRIEANSQDALAVVHATAKRLTEFMNEEAVSEFRVVPTLHIEPLVGYGPLMTDTSGRSVAVSMYGLLLDDDDSKTSFGIDEGMFAHESLHPFVTRAMHAPEHAGEARILQELFPMVEEAARATGDYPEWESYFGETITMALTGVMSGKRDYREQYTVGEGNFLLVVAVAGVLQREFEESETPFFDFYPTLVARIAEILRDNETR